MGKSLEKEFTSARDIGYVISKLEIMRDLLAEVGHQNPNESLMDCLIKFKLIRGVGQKSLKQIELTYLESLIKNLSFMKSKLLIQMREDPFLNSINSDLKVEFTPKNESNFIRITHSYRGEIGKIGRKLDRHEAT